MRRTPLATARYRQKKPAMAPAVPLAPLRKALLVGEGGAKRRMRGSNTTRGRDPSPVSHLTMRATLSHKGRGEETHTGNPFFTANSLSDTCGRAPMCWITSAAASAPRRPAFS
jgi:hypothetical protein